MLLSALIYAVFIIWTLLFSLACSPFFFAALLLNAAPSRTKQRGDVFRFFIYLYGKTVLAVVMRPWARIHVSGHANRPEKGGIYVFNHRSASDPFIVADVVPCPAVQLVNVWPMRLPYLGFFARHGGYIDIRSLSFDETRERIRRLIEHGIPVVAFPEGTRSGARRMNPFHSGIFRIAHELGCPVIPVSVAGNEKIPDRAFRMSRGTILVSILPPVPPEQVRTLSPHRLKNMLHDLISGEGERLDSQLEEIHPNEQTTH